MRDEPQVCDVLRLLDALSLEILAGKSKDGDRIQVDAEVAGLRFARIG